MQNRSDAVTHSNASPTLDVLFQRILARQPNGLALLDPLNKQRVTGQPPKRLTFAQADLAMNAAAECFSIRHVCGFGDDLPEGMASLDRAIAAESPIRRTVIQDGRKAAIVTFDVTSDGFRAVPRTHLSVIAAGLAISLESDVPQ